MGGAQEIFLDEDLEGELDRELSDLEPQTIYVGWNTDPYQPCEGTYLQTRKALELLARRGFSACLLTKSDRVVRDADVLRQSPGSSVGLSIAFQDEHVRRLFEVNAPPNERRMEALKALKAKGIKTYVLVCPVMPFLTDVETLVERVAPYADTIWIYPLSMKAVDDRNWRNVRGILDAHYPGMAERYREIAFRPSHTYWSELRDRLLDLGRLKRRDLRIEL
jgi:DNA repair photolyase